MPTLQKAILDEVKKTPERLVKELIKTKLLAAGVVDDSLAEAAAAQLIAHPESAVEIDSGVDANITITDEDIQSIKEAHERIVEALPQMIQSATMDAAKATHRKIRSDWSQRGWTVHAELEAFRANLYERWGEALNELMLLLTLCREMGEAEFRRVRRLQKYRPARHVILRLHARACQTASEMMALLETGHADGAMARWRTMHEIAIVALLVADHGDALAQRYADHEVVETKRAADAYLRDYKLLGFAAPSATELARTDKAYRTMIDRYGADFSSQYGWACEHVAKKRPTFADLEDAAGRSEMRSYYRYASHSVHAGVKGLMGSLSTLGESDVISTGATNAGLEEPGQNLAFTLTAITSLLVRRSRIDDAIQLQVLVEQRDRAASEVVKVGRKLAREHKRSSGPVK